VSPSITPDPKQVWTLPVCFKTGAGSEDCEVLSPSNPSLPVPSGTLFFANAEGKGYYRSAYPESAFAGLVKGVETGLSPSERISLLGDDWAQVRANSAPVGGYLDQAVAVKADTSAEVLNASFGGVESAMSRIASTKEEKDALAAWIRKTYAPEYAKIGPPAESDSANTKDLRASLFGILGYFGKDPGVIAQARQMAQQFISDPSSVEPGLGQTAVAIAARNGDAAMFDALEKVYETTTNPEFQEGALRLQAQFEDPALLTRALDYAASGKVRNQDAAIQFAIAMGGDETRDVAWKYIQEHWDKVQAQLTTAMGGMLVGSTSGFCSAEGKESVKAFFAAHPVPASDLALRHAVERIDGCIELRQLQEPKLKEWLAKQGM
jgi:aminopeptidase N/puromycin-sensitive aminopeptidase